MRYRAGWACYCIIVLLQLDCIILPRHPVIFSSTCHCGSKYNETLPLRTLNTAAAATRELPPATSQHSDTASASILIFSLHHNNILTLTLVTQTLTLNLHVTDKRVMHEPSAAARQIRFVIVFNYCLKVHIFKSSPSLRLD